MNRTCNGLFQPTPSECQLPIPCPACRKDIQQDSECLQRSTDVRRTLRIINIICIRPLCQQHQVSARISHPVARRSQMSMCQPRNQSLADHRCLEQDSSVCPTLSRCTYRTINRLQTTDVSSRFQSVSETQSMYQPHIQTS